MKKILTLLCAVALLFTLSAVSANAAERSAVMQITAEDQTCKPGESFKTAIRLKNNRGVASMKLYIEYDRSCLSYESASFCGGFLTKKGVSLAQAVTINGKDYVVLNWVCTEGTVADELFAEISFKAASRPASKITSLTLHTDLEDIFDADLQGISCELCNGAITFATGPVLVETNSEADGLHFLIANFGLDSEQMVRIMIAFSDANGRQSGFAVSESVAAKNLNKLQLIGANRKADDAWKLFVLDADSLAPLCESISSS